MAVCPKEKLYNAKGVPTIRRLVYESFVDPEFAVFTFTEEKEGYVSLQKLYIEHCSVDPTEQSFAEAAFGSFEYWEEIKDLSFIKKQLVKWRHRAELLRTKKAFEVLYGELDGKNSFAAAKFFIEQPWKKGRKERREANEIAEESYRTSVADDFNRIADKFIN